MQAAYIYGERERERKSEGKGKKTERHTDKWRVVVEKGQKY